MCDLAVVRDARGSDARDPSSKCVVGKTRMHERERRRRRRRSAIVVILFHLLGHQYALVSQRARRQTRNVKRFPPAIFPP